MDFLTAIMRMGKGYARPVSWRGYGMAVKQTAAFDPDTDEPLGYYLTRFPPISPAGEGRAWELLVDTMLGEWELVDAETLVNELPKMKNLLSDSGDVRRER